MGGAAFDAGSRLPLPGAATRLGLPAAREPPAIGQGVQRSRFRQTS